MLFTYVFVPHEMDKMQEFIDFIIHDVWFEAMGKDYDIDALFNSKPELRAMINELHVSELKGADFFLTGLQQIFEDFKTLSDEQLDKLKLWHHSNNDVEGLCSAQDELEPATYSDVSNLSENLSNHLKSFYKNLYSHDFLTLKSVSGRIGNIDDHYQAFISQNKQGKCPFCGISDTLGNDQSIRDAYDHYLPKSKYPFNSINFKNLVPTCHTCNSGYKSVKNTLFTNAGVRRKAFYPFSQNTHSIDLSITLDAIDWTEISSNDIELHSGPEDIREEIDTWADVYGIEERYKAKCCGENDGKNWIREIVDESANYGLTPIQYYEGKLITAMNQPWSDANFLKKPFLEACERRGLFDSI
jgi:5-methylcytosine-specific restriction endonuclease McrA